MATQVPQPNMKKIIEKSGMNAAQVANFIALVKHSMQPHQMNIPVREAGTVHYYQIERRGLGPIKTPSGVFWEYSFFINDQWGKYSVIVKGEIDPQTLNPKFQNPHRLVVRTDSGCETGQMFRDLTCDCRDQLYLAMQTLEQVGEGIIINIPGQDGRGMGITFKLATLWLQRELHINTVESAGLLAPNGTIDVRTYSGVIGILKFFSIPQSCVINLATNNPDKVKIFQENGYRVDNLPIVIAPTDDTRPHLEAKQDHLGHMDLIEKK